MFELIINHLGTSSAISGMTYSATWVEGCRGGGGSEVSAADGEVGPALVLHPTCRLVFSDLECNGLNKESD